MRYHPILDTAIKKAGGPTALAKELGIVPSAVTEWRRSGGVPPRHLPAVSRITGIPGHELRPDLWEPPSPSAQPAAQDAA